MPGFIVPVFIAVSSSASTYWYFHFRTTTRNQDEKKNEGMPKESEGVSSRGLRGLNPILPYMGSFFKCLGDPCHPIDNPQGHIALCVAENKLITDTFSKHLTMNETFKIMFSHSDNYYYNDLRGIADVRAVVARFLARKFVEAPVGNSTSSMSDVVKLAKNEVENMEEVVDPENILLATGCACVLNLLFLSLAEENDAVLIPAPYYAAFENDMKVIAKCVPIVVRMSNPSNGPTVQELENAARLAETQGLRVRILLMTNPGNPLGTIYSSKVILDSISWARGRQIHTIMDEIYALSEHETKPAPKFQSVIKLLKNNLQDNVHMIWAVSKDFGASGFRIGVLYSQNSTLNSAIPNLNLFSTIPHPMQSLLGNLLADDAFVDSFLNESRLLLKKSYDYITQTLDGNDLQIPYVPAQAGIFIYCDFSSLLPSNTEDGEAQFASLVEKVGRMVFTPGNSQRDGKHGMFRVCYAWVSFDVLCIAMDRLGILVRYIRDIGWDRITQEGLDSLSLERLEEKLIKL